MNILFYLYQECSPFIGGIERVTDILTKEFAQKYNHKLYSVYRLPLEGDNKTEFTQSFYVKSPTPQIISEIITDCRIDVIIIQEEHKFSSIIREGVSLSGRECKVIFAFHNTPLVGAIASVKFKKIFKSFKEEHRINDLIKLIIYPVFRFISIESIRHEYSDSLKSSDYNVLLAKCFIDKWYYAARIPVNKRDEYAKVIAMPNPVSFDTYADERMISNKEKRVLIVARLYEPSKRILEALKIWHEIEKDTAFEDWRLDIVGYGPDKDLYEDYIRKNLKRAKLYGRQNPEKFYERSALFLMTSSFEGWGMTLIEASQFGCVPLAYNAFDSLSEVIPENLNELIIPNNDRKQYVAKLKSLMTDNILRQNLATEAVQSAKRFSKENIASKWNSLFNE